MSTNPLVIQVRWREVVGRQGSSVCKYNPALLASVHTRLAHLCTSPVSVTGSTWTHLCHHFMSLKLNDERQRKFEDEVLTLAKQSIKKPLKCLWNAGSVQLLDRAADRTQCKTQLICFEVLSKV